MENNIKSEELIKKLPKKLFLYTEIIYNIIIFPATAVILYFIIELDKSQSNIFFFVTGFIILISTIISIPLIFILTKPLAHYLKKNNDPGIKEIGEKDYSALIKRIFILPKRHAISVFIRWILIFSIAISLNGYLHALTISQRLNIAACLMINIFFSALYYYVLTGILIEKILNTGLFSPETCIEIPKYKLSRILSSIVILVLSLLMVITIALGYNLNHHILTNSYLDQMTNLTEIMNEDLDYYFKGQQRNLHEIVKNKIIINAVKTNRYDEAISFLEENYKNVFICKPEYNPVILASNISKTIGNSLLTSDTRNRNTDIDLIQKNYSIQGYKSPDTGEMLILITAPIKNGEKTIGILAIDLDCVDYINNKILNLKFGETGYIFVLDAKMCAIGHPEKKLWLYDVLQHDWGISIALGKSGSILNYIWQGEAKFQTFIKNENFGFTVAATIKKSDIANKLFSIQIIMLIFQLFSVIIVSTVLFIIISKKLNPLKKNKEIIKDISEGNIVQDIIVKSNDEVGEISIALRVFIKRISEAIKKIQDIANELASSSNEMSVSSIHFSDNAQNQSATVEQISAIVEEVAVDVDNIAKRSSEQAARLSTLKKMIDDLSISIADMNNNIKDAMSLTGSISGVAIDGRQSLSNMSNSMNNILYSSYEMTRVISIISDIFEKINLLSLNAAIEAARAGQSGRGFAVVAKEISKLADQTANSINEIDKFIKSNSIEIEKGKSNIESAADTISTIIEGVEYINEMMTRLTKQMQNQLDANIKVNGETGEVRLRAEEISNATEEQKSASDEIAKSLAAINEVTQANALRAKQMSGTSHSLSGQAESLKKAVAFFKIWN